MKKYSSLPSINLQNCNIENTLSDSEKGCSFLYISTDLNYRVCNDPKKYKTRELESIIIEIMNKKREKHFTWLYL